MVAAKRSDSGLIGVPPGTLGLVETALWPIGSSRRLVTIRLLDVKL